jgi:regulator of protease activity HflC (stomatin/prohibitin superfamily)
MHGLQRIQALEMHLQRASLPHAKSAALRCRLTAQVDAEREREGERAGQARGEAAQAHAERKALDKEARALAAAQARAPAAAGAHRSCCVTVSSGTAHKAAADQPRRSGATPYCTASAVASSIVRSVTVWSWSSAM